jgi:hypothetical protein
MSKINKIIIRNSKHPFKGKCRKWDPVKLLSVLFLKNDYLILIFQICFMKLFIILILIIIIIIIK